MSGRLVVRGAPGYLWGMRMHEEHVRRFALAVTAGLIVWLTAGCASGPQYQVKKLPSGKEIKVLSLTTMSFSSGPPALMLKYQTDLPMDDVPALQAEANEVMDVLKIDADRANVTRAVVSANDDPKGFFVKQGKSHNFLYEKRPDGTWAPYEGSKS